MKKKEFKINSVKDHSAGQNYYAHLREDQQDEVRSKKQTSTKQEIVTTRIYKTDADKLRSLLNQKMFFESLNGNHSKVLIVDVLSEALENLREKYVDLIKKNINK